MKKARPSSSHSNVHQAARSTVRRGDVRQQVRKLTLRAVRDRDLSVRDLPDLAGRVLHGAATGLDQAMPRSSRSTLRQVVGGLTDAVAAAASATRVTTSTAVERGGTFVRRDVRRTVRDLRELEGRFLRSLQRAGRSLTGTAKAEVQTVVSEARRAGTKIRPAVQRALHAADGHLGELGSETAASGVRATRNTLSTILQGTSGLLEGLGEAVRSPRRRTAKPKRTSGSRKRTAKGKRTASTSRRKPAAARASKARA